jgi:hypothetical protein
MHRLFHRLRGPIKMKPPSNWISPLKQCGYSKKTIKDIWKWYDFSERRGAANF